MKKGGMKGWLILCMLVMSVILSTVSDGGKVRADAKAYEFLVPDADICYLTYEEIQDMPLQVVCYAKNEIYARHGRMFHSQELTNYFEEQLWYYGCISPSEFSSSVLNVYETANIKLLSDRESELRSGGYVLDQPGYDFSVVYEYIYGNLSYVIQNDYYIFPDSDSRYLTDADLEGYSSSELELAKNEIYARHGRKFVTPRIADYFNSKSWYKGTEDPETFDNNQGYIFNEYEVANISKIADTEEQRRSEGE